MTWFNFRKKIQAKWDYQITSFPIFAELGPSEQKLVEEKVRLVELKKGDMVYRRGEVATAFYLISSGRLRILRDDGSIINHLHPGDYFGETSLLTNRNHSATIQAQNDSILLKIEKDDFLSLVKGIPSLSLHISRTLGHRLSGSFDETTIASEAKIVAFYHPQAGIGNTSLVASLAAMLVRETKKKVIVLDLTSLTDIPSDRMKPEPKKVLSLAALTDVKMQRIEPFLMKSPESFDVLKISKTDFEKDIEKKLALLLTSALSHYSYALLDLPTAINPLIRKALQQSDVVYLLAGEEDRDSQKLNAIFEEFNRSFGFTQDQLRFILRERKDKDRSYWLPPAQMDKKTSVFGMLPYITELEGKSVQFENFSFPFDLTHLYAKKVRFMAREMSGKAVGLALGSGAAFGYAHLGVLKVLEEENIEIDMISASSIGAVIGGMWAAGLSATQLIEIIKTLDGQSTFFKLFGLADLSVAHKGFFKGNQVTRFLKSYAGDVLFRDLKIPVKIIATDLNTGTPVIFEEGPLMDAIRASISIPGIFRPFRWRGKYLIDGGVVDPLPIQVLNRHGAKRIIAVNVLQSPEDHMRRSEILEKKKEKTKEILQQKNIFSRTFYNYRRRFLSRQSANIFNVMVKTIQFMEYGVAEATARQADIVLRPVVIDAHWAEFFTHDKFIRRGEEETRKHMDEIKRLVSE